MEILLPVYENSRKCIDTVIVSLLCSALWSLYFMAFILYIVLDGICIWNSMQLGYWSNYSIRNNYIVHYGCCTFHVVMVGWCDWVFLWENCTTQKTYGNVVFMLRMKPKKQLDGAAWRFTQKPVSQRRSDNCRNKQIPVSYPGSVFRYFTCLPHCLK